MTALLELAMAALALWGWAGMQITVSIAVPINDWAAQAQPADDFSHCEILIHPNIRESAWPGHLLHEIGHCVGAYEHSEEPGSIMQAGGGSAVATRITDADRLAAKASRDRILTYRASVPGVSR